MHHIELIAPRVALLSRFPRRRCPRMEQFTVVCHVIVVSVDFQATFEDVLVCDLVLMALPFTFFLCLPNTSSFFCVCITSLRVLAVCWLYVTLIFSLVVIIIIIMHQVRMRCEYSGADCHWSDVQSCSASRRRSACWSRIKSVRTRSLFLAQDSPTPSVGRRLSSSLTDLLLVRVSGFAKSVFK